MKHSDFCIQPLKVYDGSIEESICYLWYIPSEIEIIMVEEYVLKILIRIIVQ